MLNNLNVNATTYSSDHSQYTFINTHDLSAKMLNIYVPHESVVKHISTTFKIILFETIFDFA